MATLLSAGPAHAGERVCVMVAKGQAQSDRLTVIRKSIEDQLKFSSTAKVVPGVDCVAAGEATERPIHEWFRSKQLREIGRSAEVDVIVVVKYPRRGAKVSVVAMEAKSGEVIGASRMRFGRIQRLSKRVRRWLDRYAEANEEEEDFFK